MNAGTGKNGIWGQAIFAALLVLASRPVQAQQYNDPGILHRPILSMPSNYRPEGIRLGGFMLKTAVDLVVEDHGNIYYQRANPTSDTIYRIRPRVSLVSGWSRHALELNLFGDFARYVDTSLEDYDDLSLSADARIDIKRGKYFTVRSAGMLMHEDRSSPDDSAGVEPTEFTGTVLGLGYHHTFNRLTAELSYDHHGTDYGDNRDDQGALIDNGDRKRSQENLELQLAYQLMPQRSLFVSLSTNTVDYDRDLDDRGFAKASKGYRARAGMIFDITGVLTGSAWVEYLEQEYDDPRFENVDDQGFGFELEWSPTRLTRIGLQSSRAPLETTQFYTSGYIGTLYAVRLQHELRRYLLVHARASYTDNDYSLSPGSPDESLAWTEVTRAELGLSYLFNRRFNLTAGYALERQDANIALERYRGERLFLTLGMEL